ncbi:MAG: VanZ family protein, partial [Myxococcales bacterium]|nr:VanZ family protein [Myxococcales bacterium]
MRGYLGGLTFLFILLIVYASWTPSDAGPVEGGLFSKLSDPREMSRGHNLRDIATNVLLYMPLGVFLALSRSAKGGSFVSLWLFGGLAVSLTMEVGQSFIGRTPDVADLVTNTSGYVMGYWIIVAAIRFYGLNPLVFMGFHAGESQDRKTQSIAAFRFIGVCVYVLIALLPFDVSVKLTDLYAQLQPDETGVPKIILDPLYSVSNWSKSGLKLTFELWALLPVAGLTAFLAGIRGRLSIFSPVFACVSVAFFCESAQICILSRRTDIAMLGVAVISGVVGWAFVRTWFKVQGTNIA